MRIWLLVLLISFSALAKTELELYYSGLQSTSGYELKTELKEILKRSHRDRGYSALFNIYFTSDVDNSYDHDGSIMDMYSENPSGRDPYVFKGQKDKCGQYREESDCFNREHIFPQGTFNKQYPMRSDFFHIYPTDGKVNNYRGNLPFGIVEHAKWTSRNGSKVGSNTFGKYRGQVFEPIDEFKGDIARALLYFATRYEDRITQWHHPMLNGTKDQVYSNWFIRLLLQWHEQDPVSAHEIQRNQAGHEFQGNRNPFIDHPEWVLAIWAN